MTTATKNAKKAPVIVSAPKIETAWKSLVTLTEANEDKASHAIERLANEVKNSQLSIRDLMKVIRATGLESSLVKVSHVEGLTTWLELRKHEDFTVMPLAKQLSTAVGAYKLLGAGNAVQLPSLEAVEKATKQARKAKNEKAKEGSPKPSKEPKKASTLDALKAFEAFIASLDFQALGDDEIEVVARIQYTLEGASVEA